ncbi:DUF475 domain-containing protein [Deinococcus peraridilitoris]|uniref:Integral membrane protein, YkoY family n=1 Tax=Deinococcus peraridilitoris (strain DSM 19664 / LMG 22246 / CIP 109416 / KR-200) TaxID=937777 RepID=L0A0P5_DEIPD|nr:DUF475 domain-containing protein [Deinococcus peraridilitoris]AFZ67463.1 hypothetical protein Deipe_1960 [Deinococcus peraridilitoris DSM 19664]
MFKHFGFGIIFSILCIIGAGVYGFVTGDVATAAQFAFIAIVLGVMEVSLSFDNAVVNAKVLTGMDLVWRHRFLTWGIAIAVVGMRFVFPILIVMATASLGFTEVVSLAFNNPTEYSEHLEEAHVLISAFGGTFLGLVFLHYFFDKTKDVHWIGPIERRLARAGNLDKVEVSVILTALLALVALTVAPAEKYSALLAGGLGILTYLLVKALAGMFEPPEDEEGEEADTRRAKVKAVSETATKAGALSFLYLEVLDASFSLDGVIGAFAISKEVVVIAAGLAIGAVFVRSMTLWLVETGTLTEYRFLEHGAHWGIGALAIIMLLSMNRAVHIPELITGLIGLGFIIAAVMWSVRANKSDRDGESSHARLS